MIEMSEEYEKKMEWSNQVSRASSPTEYTELMKNDMLMPPSYIPKESFSKTDPFYGGKLMSTIRRSRKPTFISETAFVRDRQTKRTLKMFIAVVLVFATLQLPNQIMWLGRIQDEIVNIFIVLAHVSPVVNCWIYGAFNKRFRKAYMSVLRAFILPKKQYDVGRISVSTAATKLSRSSRTSSFYDTKKQREFEERSSIFTDMFEHHKKHFDQFRHLYNLNEEEEEQETIQKTLSQKPKRKITFASFFNVHKPVTDSTISLDKSSQSKRSRSLDIADDDSSSNTEKFIRKASNSCSPLKSSTQNGLKYSMSSNKPKRKITLANYIMSALKTPAIRQRNYSLPTLVDYDEHIKLSGLSNIPSNNSTRSIARLNTKEKDVISEIEKTQQKNSEWFLPTPLSIKHNSSPNLTGRNTDLKTYDITDSKDSINNNVINTRTNAISTCSDQETTARSQREPIRYSQMKLKYKHCNRMPHGRPIRDRRYEQADSFDEHEEESDVDSEFESTDIDGIAEGFAEDSIYTTTENKSMHKNSITSVDACDYIDSDDLSTIQLTSDDTRDQELKPSSNDTQIEQQDRSQIKESRKRKTGSTPLHRQLLGEFKNDISHINENPSPPKDDNKSIRGSSESIDDDYTRVDTLYQNDKVNMNPVNENTTSSIKTVQQCHCNEYVNAEKTQMNLAQKPTNFATVKLNCLSSMKDNSNDNNNKTLYIIDKSDNRQHNDLTTQVLGLSEEVNSMRGLQTEPKARTMGVNNGQLPYDTLNDNENEFYYNRDICDKWRDNREIDHSRDSAGVSGNKKRLCNGKYSKHNISLDINGNTTVQINEKNRTYKTLPLISKCFSTSDCSVDDVVLSTTADTLPSFTRRTKLTDHVNSRIAEIRKNDIVDV